MSGIHEECLKFAKEALNAIQEGKNGSVSFAIRKLEHCANLLEDEELQKWCKFQLGAYMLSYREKNDFKKDCDWIKTKISNLNIKVSEMEIATRMFDSAGGFESIEFIEQIIASLEQKKVGNDGTHYLTDMRKTIIHASNSTYERASQLYKRLKFGEIPSQKFNTIRDRVYNLLLDICPEAVEKFMTAYENLSSSSSENWSLALTATRRVIKSVADKIYPPRKTKKDERKLGEEQYINRLWAFLDENADDGSDKDLGKAHIDYLGSFLGRLNEKASKGVHAEVTYEEAVRAVLYTYLTLGDIIP